MYQRMLDRQTRPSMAEMTAFCGENGARFAALNDWLSTAFGTEQTIVFPYGNRYGWGVSHKRKGRLVCNVFAEEQAFTVMLRLTNQQWDAVYAVSQAYMRTYIDHKYPCSDGGWIHYRVSGQEHIDDIQTALAIRCA